MVAQLIQLLDLSLQLSLEIDPTAGSNCVTVAL